MTGAAGVVAVPATVGLVGTTGVVPLAKGPCIGTSDIAGGAVNVVFVDGTTGTTGTTGDAEMAEVAGTPVSMVVVLWSGGGITAVVVLKHLVEELHSSVSVIVVTSVVYKAPLEPATLLVDSHSSEEVLVIVEVCVRIPVSEVLWVDSKLSG